MNIAVRLDAQANAETARFTAADYLRLADTGVLKDVRIELVRGELIKMMPSGFAHGEANVTVAVKLVPAYRGRAGVASDLMVRVGPDTIRAVDIAVVKPDAARRGAVGAADLLLAVEVAVSSAKRDLIEKRAEYAAAGIPTYWVVDPEAEVTYVFSDPQDGDYRGEAQVRFDEPLTLPVVGGAIIIAE